jgi:hypothetical protein
VLRAPRQLPCCTPPKPIERSCSEAGEDGEDGEGKDEFHVWYEPDGGLPSTHEVAGLDRTASGLPVRSRQTSPVALALPSPSSFYGRCSAVQNALPKYASSAAAAEPLRARRLRTLSVVPDQALDGGLFGMRYGRCQVLPSVLRAAPVLFPGRLHAG